MKRGEVWWVNFEPSLGGEIQKTRPAVIVSEDAIGVLPLRVIVPLTDWKERYAVAPWMVAILPDEQNGLDKPSSADAFQIRSMSQERFVQRVGMFNKEQMSQVLKAIKIVIGAA